MHQERKFSAELAILVMIKIDRRDETVLFQLANDLERGGCEIRDAVSVNERNAVSKLRSSSVCDHRV